MTEPEGRSEETDSSGNSPQSCRSAGSTSDPSSSSGDPEGSRFTVKEEPEERDIDVPSGTVAGEFHALHKEEPQNMEELEKVEVSENMVKLENVEGWESLENQEREQENVQEPEHWTIVNSVAGGEEEVAWELVSSLCATDGVEGLNIKVELVPEEEEQDEEEEQEQKAEEEEKEKEEVVKEGEKEKSEEEVESSWGCPVSSDEMSSGDSGPDTDSVYTPSHRSSSSSTSSSSSSSSSPKTQEPPRSRSGGGVVLKLRKVSGSEGGHGRETLYQAVSDPAEPSTEGRGKRAESEKRGESGKGRRRDGERRWKRIRAKPRKHDKDKDKDQERERDKGRERERRRRKRREERKKRRRERSRSRRRARRERRRKRLLRGVRAFSPTTTATTTADDRGALRRRGLPKIRYCPYLSTCHSSDRRRRWVLRSAVQSAQRAMQSTLPDLVGKRIRHLYEETDKSEVWYRGTVLRVHEAHPNPLKTVFEVKYDSEPEWQYYLELLLDYQKGWLKVDDL